MEGLADGSIPLEAKEAGHVARGFWQLGPAEEPSRPRHMLASRRWHGMRMADTRRRLDGDEPHYDETGVEPQRTRA